MKLQFAFGNPRRGSKKRVARRRKSRKTKSVKSKLKKAVKMAKSKRRVKRRKNPEAAIIRRDGKIIGREFSPLSKREEDVIKGKVAAALKKYKSAPQASAQKSSAYKELAKLVKEAKTKLGKRGAYLKTLQRYMESGAKVQHFDLAKKGEGKMAKKRRKKKSKVSKKSRRKKVKAAKKTAAPKRKKRRSSKKRRRSSKKIAKVSAPKKVKRSKKRKSSKKRRRARMITHKHASSTRHIKKGTSFRFKTVAKKGKRKITVSGRVKVNPRRRNPMANLSASSKKYLGLDAAELTALAVGGLSVPLVNAGISKIPGMNAVVAKINEFVGPQATGSVIPILAGVAFNVGGDYASGDAKKYLKLIGEGLAAAGVVSLVAGLSQRYVAPALGLSGMGIMPQLNGINYTPTMRGINYTPTMRGINYTPSMGIMPRLNGMGIQPQMNGADFGKSADFGDGYTEDHKTSRADFGANFSEDSEAEGLEDQENSYSSSMN